MKKFLTWTAIILVAGVLSAIGYFYFLAPEDSLNSIYLVPKDAIYVIETNKPIKNWKKISGHPLWKHLRTNDYFADLTESVDGLDSMITDNSFLFDLVGSRKLLISAHLFKKDDYDFLYIADLKKASQFTSIQNYFTKLVGEGVKVTQREFEGYTITELFDKEYRETLYLAFIENQLIASYTHTLVENSISELKDPKIGRDLKFIEVNRQIEGEGMLRVYFQYALLDDYLKCYSEDDYPIIEELANSMKYTGLAGELNDEGLISLEGYTNTVDTVDSYYSTFLKSGRARLEGFKIASQRTASFTALGFSDFTEFYKNLDVYLQKDEKAYNEYEDNLKKLEGFLKISLEENFFSWIDDEIDIINSQPVHQGKENEFAVFIKAKDVDDARENMEVIQEQIKKRTPAKFKNVQYRGYEINYMAMNGFFRLILGKLFKKLEKPYFAYLDDYLVLSNHPQTLKNLIDDKIAGNTLDKSESFKQFYDQFDSKSSVFLYFNTPVLHSNLKEFTDGETWSSLQKNKQYIVCFSQFGVQLTADDGWFETKIKTTFEDPLKVQENMENIFEISEKADALTELGVEALSNEEMQENIEITEVYLDDLSANEQVENYENGEVKVEVGIKNGLKHGSYREYYESGELKIKGRYKDDQRVGTWKMYDSLGNLLRKEKY